MPTKPIVKGNENNHIIFDYTPKQLNFDVPEAARDLLDPEGSRAVDFKINELTANQVGITELQKASLEEKIEEQALERLKDVQEKAYQEAYELGRTEGREQAFEEHKKELSEHIEVMDEMLASFEVMKNKLMAENEAHIMKLVYQVASKIAMKEIQESQGDIVEVIRQVLEDAQSDEKVTVYLSPGDMQFIEQLREKTGRDTEFLKRLKLEASESMTSGGCFVETNYGSIDASLEERLARVWKAIEEKVPRVKESSDE